MATNSDIAHNWAHQLKTYQKSGNVSFNEALFYSYGTVVAQIATLPNNQKLYLLNTGGYSNSTSKHQGYCFGAIPNDAIKFSVSCHDFIFGWRGYSQWGSGFDELAQIKLVTKYLEKQLSSFIEFKTSISLDTENKFSFNWWDEAQRLMEITKCTSLNKLLKTTNDTYKMRNVKKPELLRKMIRVLKSHDLRSPSISLIINKILGPGVYEEYCNRTNPARNAAYTRSINKFLGFTVVSRWEKYYNPYPYKKGPKSSTYGALPLEGNVDGGLNKKIIDKHRNCGDYISFLLKTKKENLEYNIRFQEKESLALRKKDAIERLERHIGFIGFERYSRRIASLNYNGVEFRFNYWNTEKHLTEEEYSTFASLSKSEKKKWIYDKRTWMLQELQSQNQSHFDYEKEKEEREIIAQRERGERQKLLKEKASYIKELEAKGDDGIRQLWHENLRDGGLYGKGVSFFYGGNTLLRVIKNSIVETSKGIEISLNECKRLWGIVNLWHNNQREFVGNSESVMATTSSWRISEYRKDIMISGCHAVAYCEMERIAKQLGFIK